MRALSILRTIVVNNFSLGSEFFEKEKGEIFVFLFKLFLGSQCFRLLFLWRMEFLRRIVLVPL